VGGPWPLLERDERRGASSSSGPLARMGLMRASLKGLAAASGAGVRPRATNHSAHGTAATTHRDSNELHLRGVCGHQDCHGVVCRGQQRVWYHGVVREFRLWGPTRPSKEHSSGLLNRVCLAPDHAGNNNGGGTRHYTDLEFRPQHCVLLQRGTCRARWSTGSVTAWAVHRKTAGACFWPCRQPYRCLGQCR
jgi:hypothetical protein